MGSLRVSQHELWHFSTYQCLKITVHNTCCFTRRWDYDALWRSKHPQFIKAIIQS